ncbi:MAG: creatininase family protein [Firmicutes bacterium]|nr:creatininase family protein [Candidatus Fermentithermobacillaceae bacterium]
MAALEYIRLGPEHLQGLPRDLTVFTMVVSPIEVHGRHLPLGTDIFIAAAVRDRVVRALEENRPEISFVNLPHLYCGSDALPYPGSLSVNAAFLEGVLTDYCKGLAKQGFRYLVVFDNHGGPRHHLAIASAAGRAWKKWGFQLIDPFIDIYRRMITHDPELLSMTGLGPAECGDDADNHAGTNETSLMMAVSPELILSDVQEVEPSYPPSLGGAAKIVDLIGRFFETVGRRRTGADLRHLAQAIAWTGQEGFLPYMGAPALASKEAGEAMLGAHVKISASLIERALAGEDVRPVAILEDLSFLRRLPE